MELFRKGLFFDADTGGNEGESGEGNGEGNGEQQTEALEWDAFHASLPEDAQKLIADRESGLKTALGSERDARKKAENDLRDTAGDMEKGSQAQKDVLKLADDIAAESQKSDFYEDAHEAGVTNLKLAYLLAKNDDLFDRKGNVDFEKMKKSNPELFGKKFVPDGNAGDGNNSQTPGGKNDMNSVIRTMSGRKT